MASQIACLNVILDWIHGLSKFVGGIVVVAMMDPHQLKPIKGEPTMLSPLMITAFNFHHLDHSAWVGRDQDLHWLQEIARMAPSSYTSNGLTEFSNFIRGKCTSVVDTKRWDHRNDLLDVDKNQCVSVIISCTGKMKGRVIWQHHLC